MVEQFGVSHRLSSSPVCIEDKMILPVLLTAFAIEKCLLDAGRSLNVHFHNIHIDWASGEWWACLRGFPFNGRTKYKYSTTWVQRPSMVVPIILKSLISSGCEWNRSSIRCRVRHSIAAKKKLFKNNRSTFGMQTKNNAYIDQNTTFYLTTWSCNHSR